MRYHASGTKRNNPAGWLSPFVTIWEQAPRYERSWLRAYLFRGGLLMRFSSSPNTSRISAQDIGSRKNISRIDA